MSVIKLRLSSCCSEGSLATVLEEMIFQMAGLDIFIVPSDLPLGILIALVDVNFYN